MGDADSLGPDGLAAVRAAGVPLELAAVAKDDRLRGDSVPAGRKVRILEVSAVDLLWRDRARLVGATCTVQADQAGDAYYAAAAPVTRDIEPYLDPGAITWLPSRPGPPWPVWRCSR